MYDGPWWSFSRSFFDFLQHAAGVASGKYPFRYIFCHHAARFYYRPCTDPDTGAYDGSTSYPSSSSI
jgi:hypothetical protein